MVLSRLARTEARRKCVARMSSSRKRSSSHVTLEEKLSKRDPVHVTPKELKRRCARVLELTSAHEFAWPFNQPVVRVSFACLGSPAAAEIIDARIQ